MHAFFFNDTATTEIYTLSLHDALPISALIARVDELEEQVASTRDDRQVPDLVHYEQGEAAEEAHLVTQAAFSFGPGEDRKSTRLNSSHANISYAVFCLKKKNITDTEPF